MGRRKQANLGRVITARYGNTSTTPASGPDDGGNQLSAAEKFRFRRRPNASGAELFLHGTNCAGVSPQRLAAYQADSKARIAALKRCYHGGIPDSW